MSDSGWQVLDFSDFKGSLTYKRGNVHVNKYEDGSEVDVPLAHAAVVIIGGSVTVSGALLSKLSEYDIALLVCDWRKVPVAGAMPWREHTRIGARQQAQAATSLPRRKNAWARIVRAKILGQANTLLGFSQAVKAKSLRNIAKAVRSGDPDNKEALAARLYWSSFARMADFARDPGSATQGWNSALDYAYTILRGHGIRAIASAGLSGTLGVFHRGRGNPFALVDDLIEPFRPAIDDFVFHHVASDAELTPDTRHQLVACCDRTFSSDGHSIPTVFTSFAQNFGMYVEGDTNELTTPVWEGPFDAEEE